MPVDPRALANRLLASPPVRTVRAVLETYGNAAGGLLANGLAFAALFAALPTMLLMLGIAGYIVDDEDFQGELAAQLASLFPPQSELIDDALSAVSEGAGLSSVVGLIGLVWTVSQFYATLDTAFSRIFVSRPQRGLAGRTVRGFIWVASLVGIVLIVIVLTTLASVFNTLIPERIPILGVVTAVATSPITILALAVVVVAIAYRVLPTRTPRWGSIVMPAVVVGIGLMLLTQAFSLLVPVLVGRASVAGSLAAAFVVLAWLSWTFQALLLGASWVRVIDRRVDP